MAETIWRGDLAKMSTGLDARSGRVHYRLGQERLGQERLAIDELLGRVITIEHTGTIHCRVCGETIPKTYGEGYCYTHFQSDPANAPCVIHPELCQAHEGKGRDIEWERKHHDQPHIVYLADSGGLKVGVTRSTNCPSRWIDQGAHAAVVLARAPHRYLAGVIEVALKGAVSDKTRWQRMLTGVEDGKVSLAAEHERVAALLPTDLAAYIAPLGAITTLRYPSIETPQKIKSLNLSRAPEHRARLIGIRAQYLIFEQGIVVNIRRHTGFEVQLSA